MQNFEIIIGVENHVELKTNSKMFSPSKVSYGEAPNTLANEIDLAYPGTLPSVNKKAVELAVLACNALNMQIDTLLTFDRKNYFYPDLTKGFQITQQFNPIGKNGSLEITLENGNKKVIEIERLHIEEDTAKQVHKDNLTYLDYNRSGVGLIEIVTKPVLRSAEEACLYVEKLREILLFLNVSDVKMNEGSLRTDLNISLRPYGSDKFSNKVEIKNLNSISNIKKAVEFEINRQKEILLKNQIVEQQTRRYDDQTSLTILMRSKIDSIDYRYFREPNIFPIQLEKSWIKNVISNSPELADQKRIRYVNELGLTSEDANIILTSLEMTNFFEKTIKLTSNYNKVAKMLISEIQAKLNLENKTIDQIELSPENLASVINLIDKNIISSKQTKVIMPIILDSNTETVEQIVERLNLKLITNKNEISKLLVNIINQNKELLEQYPTRPERVIKTIMGQLMKQTNGNVDPEIANQIVIKSIEQNL
ncbi:Asp-tRNA(Asn)/Glu-tRNA(Gln) amidotransferase subunit GatB [Mycoplasma capricolum]|uniref:Aspartyl/glutamyl-tRNA(Asn/Gln) amidotransferase subunit B n=1 Tax=Mycoplasma capricolum subsp. capripneumoniae 87001 TaxID=1124992 RepID=A0A9N7B1G2_MYCCC|nr:Asp-tRNA(Asn)/Glu-tRNA(Gln) amidotransferase subunit GatB [Mycoplasma capricolum]AJK51745.1 aspartyl/glutamyl-tRNA amidotransferase subunit B [Mycoplasma capricolum subsp. capripneumoniae 87001]AQU77691.1 aspartyl/glutamyl-tRNA amidotransferase subunit B [Mycoplasma capricolum subsp. capripneumoniae]UVO24604.1 Asp-tRNA(Asn)/Glu-tRNA(Gln) amidotransferase subunit GatB [Mycoplasma capricolum subsp. capripneumoniae]